MREQSVAWVLTHGNYYTNRELPPTLQLFSREGRALRRTIKVTFPITRIFLSLKEHDAEAMLLNLCLLLFRKLRFIQPRTTNP